MKTKNNLSSENFQAARLPLAASIALISLPVTSHGATIVDNNTGSLASSIMIVDNGGPGFTNNLAGTNGSDVAAITYGNDGLWADAGSVTYSFSGLADGVYNIYGTWYANGDTSANGYSVNGSSLGTISITADPDFSAGFTAFDEAVETAANAEPFQLIGQATVSGTGLIEVIVTPQGANGFGRFDAVGIVNTVPEPGSTILAAFAGLGLMLRRRR